MSACSPVRCAVYFWAWVGDGQASSSSIIGLLTCARRGLIAVTKYKRAMTARFLSVAKGNISRLRDAQAFHRRGSLPGLRGLFLGLVLCATFHACAMRKHFTRRSNDRRISCLRDSADISPPGQLARLARSDFGLGLFTVKWQRLTRRGIAFSWRRQRYCFTTNTRLCG